MEFWQCGEHRMHDRLINQRDDRAWKIDSLPT
ncbi:pyridoxine 5'-phosphate oxidase C-terminal domain-containing protein, partial [Salmonella sp. s57379]